MKDEINIDGTVYIKKKVDENIKLFSYGTLQDPDVQMKVLGRKLGIRWPTNINGFKLRQLEIEGIYYPAAEIKAGSNIRGNIYEIKSSDLAKLDEYETYKYKRIAVPHGGFTFYMYVVR